MPPSRNPLDVLMEVVKSPALAGEVTENADLWKEVRRLAEIHRFSGLLAHSSSAWLPATERPWRDQVLMQHHRRHAGQLRALQRILEAFAAEGIACISLKGPLLAERFCPLPYLRASNDLDLLVPLEDAGAAARVMGKLGYRLENGYPWKLQHYLSHHFNFGSMADSPRVELHYDLRTGAGSLDTNGFFERAVVWNSAAGFAASVMAPADEAFYCCVHAGHHAFHRLRWLHDVILIARQLSETDRERVRQLALQHSQTGYLVAAGFAAREFLGDTLELDCARLPVPWLWKPLSPKDVRRMVERVEGNTATTAEKIGFRLDLCRMAGTPLKAAELTAAGAAREIRKAWYDRFHRSGPEALAATLPD